MGMGAGRSSTWGTCFCWRRCRVGDVGGVARGAGHGADRGRNLESGEPPARQSTMLLTGLGLVLAAVVVNTYAIGAWRWSKRRQAIKMEREE